MPHTLRNQMVLFVFLLFFLPAILFAGNAGQKTVTVLVAKKNYLIGICNTWLENPDKWPEIARFNSLDNPHLIYPGQTIKIPAKLLKGIPMDGTVTFIKGRVWGRLPEADGAKVLSKGDIVGQGSRIETGADSAVEISFEDGSSFFLRPETRVRVQTARQRQPFFTIRKLFVPAGKTMMHIQKSTGEDSRFEIHTPSAISAARGTRFRVSVDADEVTRTEVLEGVVGVSGKGREVIVDPGQGTWVKKGTAASAPEPLLAPPSIGGLKPLYQILPVELALTPQQKAMAGRVVISIDKGMKDVVKDVLVKTGGLNPRIMLGDGVYYCRTLSISKSGLEGRPSDPVTFEIRINPLPPFIQSPQNGKQFKTDKVDLTWLKVGDAVSYQLQVSKEPEFQSLFLDTKAIKKTKYSLQLDGYGVYYFRVRSMAGDGFKGLWSDAARFVFVEPPKTPETEPPAVDENRISLRWQDMGPGITYTFQMAAKPGFETILFEKKTDQPDITFDKPEKGGVYYVRVRAEDQDGYAGAFTPSQTFEIKTFPYFDVGAIVSWVIGVLIIAL